MDGGDMSTRTRTVDLKISAEVDTLLDELSAETGCTKADIIRRGLAVMKGFQTQRKLGQTHIGFTADPSKLDTEITGVL
jgi:hypothetical protein